MDFPIWGESQIDPNAVTQMRDAMKLPVAVAGALMPDAHLGYGLPIGGVLALDNAVCTYGVGVDIACRMKLSILPIDASALDFPQVFINILNSTTYFGIGIDEKLRANPHDHAVLDEDWGFCPPIKDNRETAKLQLGSSGSGNHFVEFGVVNGKVAVLSHSGSRGVGAQVCKYYTDLAKAARPEWGDMAWLDLDSELGQEYWAAMELMGKYAAANHDCIHSEIWRRLQVIPDNVIENHHNFAWKETHNGREVIVHRKGATPASFGTDGIIPGSMGTNCYIVKGKGSDASLHSASHGAGRKMSRKLAKKTINYQEAIDKLTARGIIVLSAGADEVCEVYKNIEKVMAAQTDLVDTIGVFQPRIVKMCGTKDKAED